MYFHSAVLLVCLSCLLFNGRSSAAAPDDTGSYCRDMSALPEYPPTVKRLMDSWSYQQLLSDNNGPWMALDKDSDNRTWDSITGETCREKVFINEPQNLPQNNWLITQYINKSIPTQYNINPTNIYINISYILDSTCINLPCSANFKLYYHKANQSDSSIAVHTDGYTLLANVTSLDDTSLHMKTFKFVMDPQDNGFYAAIRDVGSNITIVRLFIYRLIGPEMQQELTLFPQTPAPITECVNITGTCAANANTTSGRAPVLTLDPSGSWTDSEECLCIEGHEPVVLENKKQCQACVPSTYKATLSNTNCQPCPANTFATEHGASICGCNLGYYRAPNETPDIGCTAPPSAPRSLSVTGRTNVTVNITWNPPSEDGGRNDLFYNIFVILSTNVSNVIKVNPVPIVGVTSYTIGSLEPKSFYLIQVRSENGVSNQSSPSLRTVTTTVRTSEGVARQVIGVRVISEMFVEWNLLSDSDRGAITRYQVQFTAGSHSGRIIDIDRNTAVYQVNVTSDFPIMGQPVYVSVRGFTDIGPGQWSVPVLFAQVNPFVPSSVMAPSSSSSPIRSVVYTPIVVTTTTSSTSSIARTTATTTNGGTRSTATPSATPSESTGTPAYISIVAVLGGALLIIILVTMGAIGYYIFRRLRLKYSYSPSQRGGKDETDDDKRDLVKYEVLSRNEDDDRVQLNPLAETT